MSANRKKSAIGSPALVLGIILSMSILFMLVSLVYVGFKRADLQKHLGLSGEHLLLSQQMANYAIAASSGSDDDFKLLTEGALRFDEILQTYRNGGDEAPSLSSDLSSGLTAVENSWAANKKDITVILNGKGPISEVRELYQVIDSFTPQMLTYSDEVVGVLMRKQASSRQIYLASRQMMLSQRIKNNLNKVLVGGEAAAAAADRFGRDAALFGRVLEGLLKGSKSLRIAKVTDREAVGKLREVAMLIKVVSDNIAGILE
ncbi:MAG: type IV pili methyl-accepting chemotaxis transducer N-terminal domain-containing protein, partial [Gammaproteobacteria bacterium]|nr:type IV pili methyl-accepting chemotaxis transducer N-terminal domain-containing protein [Gammaproteobacteria bacterium]